MNNDRMHNMIFYCLAALAAILLAYWFKTAPDNVVKILLYPQARATEIFYHTSLVYLSEVGYSAMDGTFAIGRGCMGSKFIIIMFGMTACMFARYFKGVDKAAWFITCLTGAILVGIIISCIRIIGSVPFAAHPKFALLHSSIGISLYLFALTASYAVLKKLVRGDKCAKNI